MSNMSYCRFESTNRDLGDCESALEDMINGEGSALSNYELDAAKALIARCQSILSKMAEFTQQVDTLAEGFDESDALNHDFDPAVDALQALAEGQQETGDEE